MNVSADELRTKTGIQNPRDEVPTPPLVSVIIPDYNHGQYIGDAIQSVLVQDYRRFEIIVVDDGSTDNSQEIVAKFGNQIHYIWQENQGLSAARNTGIKMAKGKYICVLDADDMYEPDFLVTMVGIMEANPDVDAVYCGYKFVDENNNSLPQQEVRSIPGDQLHQTLVDGNFLVPESWLVRQSCYANVGPFDTTLTACEDTDMWLRITSRHKVTGTPKILTRHRVLRDSMSSDPDRLFQNRLSVTRKHFGQEPANLSDWTTMQKRAYSQAYLASTIEYLQCHREDRAYECFIKMVEIRPELLKHTSTFYELGCGDQPKGLRGHLPSLNIEYNERVLLKMLDNLFDKCKETELQREKFEIYAKAYLTLGILSYRAQQSAKARRFLFHAVAANPKFVTNWQLIATFIKSIVGFRLINYLKNKG